MGCNEHNVPEVKLKVRLQLADIAGCGLELSLFGTEFSSVIKLFTASSRMVIIDRSTLSYFIINCFL